MNRLVDMPGTPSGLANPIEREGQNSRNQQERDGRPQVTTLQARVSKRAATAAING